jgi:hypothetical protein
LQLIEGENHFLSQQKDSIAASVASFFKEGFSTVL